MTGDRTQRAAYVEAAGPGLVGWFQRFGYAPVGEPVRLPDGATLHRMWRQPRRGAQGGEAE